MDCHDKYLNTHKSPPTPLQSSLSENATSRTFNKYDLKALNNWKSTICLFASLTWNIALLMLTDKNIAWYSLLLWDALRCWDDIALFSLTSPPLPFHLSCQLARLYSPIIRVLVIACKCPGAVETDKRYIKRVCGILFITLSPSEDKCFGNCCHETEDSKSHVLCF